ncbi:MAG: nicotinate-nucleotide adenylyltransferase [Candidatus Aminicenantes bacterium]|nr:nicotinate-nucleotide adenylyltransferase [Candidatus Aminicenantes bacterium]
MAWVGLFGGTFNPIHNGHLKVAEQALEHFPLNRLLFIPSYLPPHKESRELAAVEHRLKMVELACRRDRRFEVCDVEIRTPQTSYSILTLRKMKEIYLDHFFLFILGVDAFLEIDTWKDYPRLFEECSFIVVKRPGFDLGLIKKKIKQLQEKGVKAKAGEPPPRQDNFSCGQVFLLDVETPDISSSEIRKRIQSGLPIDGLVPEEVAEYIKKYNLYR